MASPRTFKFTSSPEVLALKENRAILMVWLHTKFLKLHTKQINSYFCENSTNR